MEGGLTQPMQIEAAVTPASWLCGACVHCGEPLGRNAIAVGARDEFAPADVAQSWVCCVGCRVAWALSTHEIAGSVKLDLAAFAHWDQAELLDACENNADGSYTISLALDAIHCPNCAWLIERTLREQAPETTVIVDVPLRLAHLQFYADQRALSTSIAALAALGYSARLITEKRDRTTQKKYLKQLFVAGFCAVQAMMFAEPLYWTGTDLPPQTAHFFAWLSALITLPVVAYSAARFFRGAQSEIRLRRPAMDTLISLSIILAMLGSMVGLIQGNSAVYFDAVAMFVFFLLLGRMLESVLLDRARVQAMRLSSVVPALATLESGEQRPIRELKIGDRLRAEIGAVLVADGVLESASCELSAALLDGEFAAKSLLRGAPVFAGASVRSGACIYTVQALGADTKAAQIASLSRRAAATRLPNAEEQSRLASRFTLLVLTLAVATAALWWWLAPDRALAVTLSVLTVACPCALGLALPLTRAVAHARLQSLGVLLLKPDALERLTQVDCVLFDKTGTLTEIALDKAGAALKIHTTGTLTSTEALNLACALETGQSHPLAGALMLAAKSAAPNALQASAVDFLPGLGLSGTVAAEQWRLGSPLLFGLVDDGSIVLDGPRGRAFFEVEERLQMGAMASVIELKALGLALEIVSGDSKERVERVAERLAITPAHHRCSPTQKLALVRQHSAAGRYPMMLGDGINDAIALASAHVAVSVATASALAHAHADVLLLKQDLAVLPELIRTARRSAAIAHQNLIWAQGYNLVAIPLAALGLVGPGWAALGMGLSSLVVTANAARLWPWRRPQRFDLQTQTAP